jgi:hypothetical protein
MIACLAIVLVEQFVRVQFFLIAKPHGSCEVHAPRTVSWHTVKDIYTVAPGTSRAPHATACIEFSKAPRKCSGSPRAPINIGRVKLAIDRLGGFTKSSWGSGHAVCRPVRPAADQRESCRLLFSPVARRVVPPDGAHSHRAVLPAEMPLRARVRVSEQDAKLAQKLGQLQPFLDVLPQECVGQLAYFGPT